MEIEHAHDTENVITHENELHVRPEAINEFRRMVKR
jgi:hypothetical protein